jgi:hypothetical protein
MPSVQQIELSNMTSIDTFLLVKKRDAEIMMLRQLAKDALALAREAMLANPTLTKKYELAHMRGIALGLVKL